MSKEGGDISYLFVHRGDLMGDRGDLGVGLTYMYNDMTDKSAVGSMHNVVRVP